MKIINNKSIFSLLENKNIAIVGSSPNLKDSKQGSFIDSHDIVIRFNDALIFHSENPLDFGYNCNIWAISGWSSEYEKTLTLDKHKACYYKNVPHILGTRPLHNDDIKHLSKGLKMNGPIFNLISNLDCKYIDTPKEIFDLPLLDGYFNLSSGVSTLLLLLHFKPKKISMLGFNFFNHKIPTHFWNDEYHYTEETKKNNEGHDGEFEKHLVKTLAKNFNINLVE